jgi:uncharacterized protein
MNPTPSTEDRIWAVLSHLSALAFGMGILLPIIGWSDQRRKSNYSSFQCLQALGYQSVGFTGWVLSFLVIFLGGIILFTAMGIFSFGNTTPDTIQTPGMIVFFILVFGFFALYLILPIIAAIACALGRNFHYPIIGKGLARYVAYEPEQKRDEQLWLDEDREYRWVAAMGHFSILIFLWGMLAPLMAWILQGKNNLFLKFQSIQTLAFQALTTILYFVGAILYVFGIFLLVFSMGALGGPDLNSSPGMIGTVILMVILLIAAALILFVPLLHILGQWAGYRVLKGENYHYPWIGRWVEKWSSNISTSEEKPA